MQSRALELMFSRSWESNSELLCELTHARNFTRVLFRDSLRPCVLAREKTCGEEAEMSRSATTRAYRLGRPSLRSPIRHAP